MASKYDRIATELRSRIRTGGLSGQLPAETDLAERYGVALNTLRRALDVLESEGLVSSVQGTGTFVRKPRQRVRRNPAERYRWEKRRAQLPESERRTAGATEHDTGLHVEDLDFQATYTTQPAGPELAVRFGVEPGTPLLRREYRSRAKAETAPLSLATSYLVVSHIEGNPALLSVDNEPWPGGTHHQLSTVGIEIDEIHDEITARPPYADEVDVLQLEPGVAVMVLWKTSMDASKRVVEVSEVILPGDRTQIDYITKLEKWR